MYNIYVTNETGVNVYVRLQRHTISSLNENFHQDLESPSSRKVSKYGVQTGNTVNSYLVRWGFCTIPPGKTMSFGAEMANNETRMYASLYAQSKLWIMDYEVNCARYGCVFIKSDLHLASALSQTKETLYLRQANPKPVWVPKKDGGQFSRRHHQSWQ